MKPIDRRQFVGQAMGTAGYLLIAFQIPSLIERSRAIAQTAAGKKVSAATEINAWLKIGRDGTYTFVLDRAEMGQGVMTALPTMFGEELDIDPRRFFIEQAPADRRYDNPDLNMQVTGGSTSVHAAWQPLRQAAADLRARFLAAAAVHLDTKPQDLRTEDGAVVFGTAAQVRRVNYHELIDLVVQQKAKNTPLRDPSNYRYIGQNLPRAEARSKVTGLAQFGVDVGLTENAETAPRSYPVIDGLKIAIVIRPPFLGAQLVKSNLDAASKANGVTRVVVLPEHRGVAIVARSYWYAREASKLIELTWEASKDNKNASLSSEGIRDLTVRSLAEKGQKVKETGSIENALVNAPLIVDATYDLPYLAHATMEPQNCTAIVTDAKCEVWAPTQSPALAHAVAVEASGLKPNQVTIHTTLLGGGFGRRLGQDYVEEAVHVARLIGEPVKVMWSREDDMRHSPYRPVSMHQMRGAVDNQGNIVAWEHRLASPSILAQLTPDWAPAMMPSWVPGFVGKAAGSLGSWAFKGRSVDDTAVEGAKDIAYRHGSFRLTYHHVDPGIPVGFWRSVGHSYTAFAVESFVDELAVKAGEDPLQFRLRLLPPESREKAVLQLVGQNLKPKSTIAGSGRGYAQHASFRSFAAVAVDVEVSGTTIRVRRVIAAVDCGRVINPDMVRAQVEGGIMFGLSAALYGKISIKDGAVVESNFDDYQILRMNEAPEIEVHIVSRDDMPPTGIGEPGVPPVAPALANALFAATGTRLRSLPLKLT